VNFIFHTQTSQDEIAWLLQNLREQVHVQDIAHYCYILTRSKNLRPGRLIVM